MPLEVSYQTIRLINGLKGQGHEIFDPRFFFHKTIPPRALIHGLKPFRILLRIRRESRVGSRLFFVRVPL
jgi:hypothetical protein